MTNQFRLKPGQWTDDTSMALCLADSLLCRQGFDGADLRQRFYSWCFGGYNTPFAADPQRTVHEGMKEVPLELEDMWFFDRGPVGCGTNMSKSLESLADTCVGVQPPPVYEAPTEDAGNAPLIRLAPLPVFFHARPVGELLAAARASSYTTHPGHAAAECCAFLAFALREALLRPMDTGIETMRAFLERTIEAYCELPGASLTTEVADVPGKLGEEVGAVSRRISAHSREGRSQAALALLRVLRSPDQEPSPDSQEWNSPELAWRWRIESPTRWRQTLQNRGIRWNGYPVSGGYVGSFAFDGLAIALWASCHTCSFDEALERCVNLQGDADSTAAICGALCGAFYGMHSINPRIVSTLQRWDGGGDIALRGVLLWHLGKVYDGTPASLPRLGGNAETKAISDKVVA